MRIITQTGYGWTNESSELAHWSCPPHLCRSCLRDSASRDERVLAGAAPPTALAAPPLPRSGIFFLFITLKPRVE